MAERAVSERWIDEGAELLAGGGPTRTYVARCWLRPLVPRGDLVSFPDPRFVAVSIEARGPAAPPLWYAETALYPQGAGAGALPLAMVWFPVEVGLSVQERGELVVRGEAGPGRALVAVLPDGAAVGCVGPATPVPAIRRRRVRL